MQDKVFSESVASVAEGELDTYLLTETPKVRKMMQQLNGALKSTLAARWGAGMDKIAQRVPVDAAVVLTEVGRLKTSILKDRCDPGDTEAALGDLLSKSARQLCTPIFPFLFPHFRLYWVVSLHVYVLP